MMKNSNENGPDDEINNMDTDLNKFAKDNFEAFNFPKENDGSFTVLVEDRLADIWEACFENNMVKQSNLKSHQKVKFMGKYGK